MSLSGVSQVREHKTLVAEGAFMLRFREEPDWSAPRPPSAVAPSLTPHCVLTQVKAKGTVSPTVRGVKASFRTLPRA